MDSGQSHATLIRNTRRQPSVVALSSGEGLNYLQSPSSRGIMPS